MRFLLFSLALIACLTSASADSPPNVLMIAIDDLNDWVGCLGGHPQAKTPNIDALANRGVLFTNAHCQGPICGPSRASLFSGKYAHTTGVYQQPTSKLSNDDVHFLGKTLPEYFAKCGYKTTACGKLVHGYKHEHAFQRYGGKFDGFGPKPAERFNYHLPDVPWTGTQTDWGAFPDTDSKMPDFKTAAWAVKELGKKHNKPFFIAAGMFRPHVPFYVPEKWFRDFPIKDVVLPAIHKDDLDDVPAIGRAIHALPKYPRLDFLQQDDSLQFRKCVQAYLACTFFVDYQVGRVLNALAESSYADNTVIVLFSDHGYHLGEKDRVSKHSLWEESTRVPMIIAGKGVSQSHRCDKPVGLIDIFPTLTDLCGQPTVAANEGKSLRPLLDDAEAEWRDAILTTYAKGNHAVRGNRFRYIRYEDGSEELYDHRSDPNEWKNLAGDKRYAADIQRLKSALPTVEAPYHPATKTGAVNEWFAQHLKANGIQ